MRRPKASWLVLIPRNSCQIRRVDVDGTAPAPDEHRFAVTRALLRMQHPVSIGKVFFQSISVKTVRITIPKRLDGLFIS